MLKLNISFLFLTITTLAFARYDPTQGLEYAYASALAYCQNDAITSWTCGIPCQALQGYQTFTSQLFILSPAETLSYSMIYHSAVKKFVVIFRGTVGDYELNLEMDLSNALPYQLTSVPGGLVNDYFYTRYVENLRASVISEIKKAYALFSDYTFIFTGHSLGGALTTIAAFDMVTSGLLSSSQVMMYNYGSPRVGNQALAEAIQKAIPVIYRVVHWRDTVPHLPPCLVGWDGKCTPTSLTNSTLSGMWPVWHVENEIFYNEDNTDYAVCEGGEDPTCADQFAVGFTTWADHFYYVGVNIQCL